MESGGKGVVPSRGGGGTAAAGAPVDEGFDGHEQRGLVVGPVPRGHGAVGDPSGGK